MADAVAPVRVSPPNPLHYSLQQTMLRIKSPQASIDFYKNTFGFQLIHKYDFPQWKFSLYFLAILAEDEPEWPEPGTPEAEERLWTMRHSCLELTYNHGSEDDESFAVSNGNVEPYRGFGHIAMMTRDVYAACAEMEAAGVPFQKKPQEGRMKGLAFVLDPDGYWIEIISRDAASPVQNKFTLAQTMLRVKDPAPVIRFYEDVFKMSVLRELHFDSFSLYFVATLPEGTPLPDKDMSNEVMRTMFPQVIELTHNHGTENDPDFSYYNGNDQDKDQVRGFGHVGFLVDDLEAACAEFDAAGVQFKKRPEEGGMRGLAFVYSPVDNYWVEVVQKGLKVSV
jgi:lactoylglutathione lyase